MGFLDTLRRALTAAPASPSEESAIPRAIGPGGIVEESGADAGSTAPHASAGQYDRAQWHKKLKRILDELPASKPEWDVLMYEARALELDPEWVAQAQHEEFLLLVRRVVSDRIVTESEHRKLDLARELLGVSEAQAEVAVHAIVAEAESFFGKPVRDV
ncbi:hypothetical protein [Singulisphaera acidiphila]|uniref:Uncharacterized protein n=1 Tax=Singulisphaera acidiphila (strain ATCC BAA-1392 / DSM 18658 / VKM B-2454 / MOB10) TaxID=886293 RepID=L0DPD6_SINAD|nr:hypothetical protein [Singulisphaera acidiphila]AGA31122.1 hypothetical protein Sinac_7068 [Singulisphaera acidiphila DSM 18658]